MNRLMKWVAAGLVVAGIGLAAAAAQAQVVVYRPYVTAPAALQTYYAPVAPVTSYYAPATTAYYAPTTSYYAPTTSYYAPAPVTTYYAPATTAYAAPVTSYYAPAAVGAAVYRPNPILRPFHYTARPVVWGY